MQTPGGASLLDAAVNMWAMRAFDFQSTTDLGGTIDAQISNGSLTIRNHTPYLLTGCVVLQPGMSTMPIGRLEPGGRGDTLVLQPFMRGTQKGLLMPQSPPAGTAIDPRMQSALAAYAAALTQPDNGNGYYYNGQGMAQPRPAFDAAPDEALLVGWSDDPALAGPAPRVDGHAVPVHSTTLVVVHLPLPASLVAQAPPTVLIVPPSPRGYPMSQTPGFQRPMAFGYISRSSALYQKAVDARTLKITASNIGKPVTVRGMCQGSSTSSGIPGMTMALSPQTGATAILQGTTLRLPFASNSQSAHTLMTASEIVAFGTLTSGPGGPQVVVSQPSQIKLVARGLIATLPIPPPPPLPTHLYGFRTIPQKTSAYRQAVDAHTLTAIASNVNKRVTVRGLVSGNAYTVSPQSMIVTLGSQTLLLVPVSLGEQFRSLAMMHRELVVTGPLTRRGNSPQIAITQLSQVLIVVGGSNSRKLSPNSRP